MTRLARRYRFSASHRLYTEALSAEENQALYGKCANPFGHGHNYVLEVSVAGETDPQSGRVAAPGELDDLVRRTVVARFDHADLNTLQDFAALVPTTENLALVVRRRLCAEWPENLPPLARIRIEETGRNSIELLTMA